MSTVVDLSGRCPPVTYSVTIAHHFDGTLEVFVSGVSGDERSRASVGVALARAAGAFDAWPLAEADEMNRALLLRIDALMGAAPNTPEAAELSRLATVVQAYEAKRFRGDRQ